MRFTIGAAVDPWGSTASSAGICHDPRGSLCSPPSIRWGAALVGICVRKMNRCNWGSWRRSSGNYELRVGEIEAGVGGAS